MANENLVLEHLKHLRNEIRDLRREVQSGFKDMRTRMASMEMHESAQYVDTARHSTRIDELQERIEAIERRLEVSDT